MTANKNFYNFEKIEERGQKKFKKIIAHNLQVNEWFVRCKSRY